MPRRLTKWDAIPEPQYLLVDTTHRGYADFLAKCQARHQDKAPDTLLSVTTNVAGTRAYIKVSGGSNIWIAANRFRVSDDCPVLEVHTRQQQYDFIAGEFSGPLWQPVLEEELL